MTKVDLNTLIASVTELDLTVAYTQVAQALVTTKKSSQILRTIYADLALNRTTRSATILKALGTVASTTVSSSVSKAAEFIDVKLALNLSTEQRGVLEQYLSLEIIKRAKFTLTTHLSQARKNEIEIATLKVMTSSLSSYTDAVFALCKTHKLDAWSIEKLVKGTISFRCATAAKDLNTLGINVTKEDMLALKSLITFVITTEIADRKYLGQQPNGLSEWTLLGHKDQRMKAIFGVPKRNSETREIEFGGSVGYLIDLAKNGQDILRSSSRANDETSFYQNESSIVRDYEIKQIRGYFEDAQRVGYVEIDRSTRVKAVQFVEPSAGMDGRNAEVIAAELDAWHTLAGERTTPFMAALIISNAIERYQDEQRVQARTYATDQNGAFGARTITVNVFGLGDFKSKPKSETAKPEKVIELPSRKAPASPFGLLGEFLADCAMISDTALPCAAD